MRPPRQNERIITRMSIGEQQEALLRGAFQARGVGGLLLPRGRGEVKESDL